MPLSIIIPSRNSENLTRGVQAIRAASETCRIIVVDDGLIQKPKGCTYIEGFKPFVFARNINCGIVAADNDDVVLLNDDALLRTPEGFSALQRQWRENPEYGIISAVTYQVGNTNQLPRREGLREDKRMLCFVAVFIPRSTIESVGLLDERFVHYGYDDDDYSLRIRQAGLKLGIYDFCQVDHHSLPSTFRASGCADLEPNRRLYREKWGSVA